MTDVAFVLKGVVITIVCVVIAGSPALVVKLLSFGSTVAGSTVESLNSLIGGS